MEYYVYSESLDDESMIQIRVSLKFLKFVMGAALNTFHHQDNYNGREVVSASVVYHAGSATCRFPMHVGEIRGRLCGRQSSDWLVYS